VSAWLISALGQHLVDEFPQRRNVFVLRQARDEISSAFLRHLVRRPRQYVFGYIRTERIIEGVLLPSILPLLGQKPVDVDFGRIRVRPKSTSTGFCPSRGRILGRSAPSIILSVRIYPKTYCRGRRTKCRRKAELISSRACRSTKTLRL